MQMKHLFITIFLLLILTNLFSQKFVLEDVKAIYTLNIIKYIDWGKTNTQYDYDIGIISKDTIYYHSLNHFISLKKQWNYKVKMIDINTEKIKKYKIIYIDEKYNGKLNDIYNKYSKNQNIFITNKAKWDKSMINFYLAEKKLQLKINIENIKKENIPIKAQLELIAAQDIQTLFKLFNEKENEILEQQIILQNKNTELKKMETLLSKRLKDLSKLQDSIVFQKKAMKAQHDTLLALAGNINEKEKEVQQTINALNIQKRQLEIQEKRFTIVSKKIKEQENEMLKREEILKNQNEKISKHQKFIKEQDKKLTVQDTTIKTQRSYIYLFIIIGFLLVGMLFIIYRSFRNKSKINKKLQNTIDELNRTQNQLVAAEKMAALGGLVAGVAHEINTPVGVAYTVATHQQKLQQAFIEKYKQGNMKRADLNEFLKNLNESNNMINYNIKRAAELVKSFKQVSADQSNDEKRIFNLKQYTNQIILNLKHEFKHTNININVDGNDNAQINTYAGVFSQVITNLLMNAKIHAFENMEDKTDKKIDLIIEKTNDTIKLKCVDNGKGIKQEHLSKIYEPFYTTKRNKGGTGLGLNIVHNLITQKMNGTIEVSSKINQGTCFTITLPQSI